MDKQIVTLSSDEILTTIYPPVKWVLPAFLPEGLALLAGAPKLGKSWLGLQIALAVASGGIALGECVQRGAVLILSLEDSPRRLQTRLTKQGWTRGLDADFLTLGKFDSQVGDLRNSGGERLARQIETRGYRLCIIDTLSRSVRGDQNDVAAMTRALTPLQEIAHAKNCAILLVDHHRKSSGENPDAITDILGSTAKGAMADTVWGLYRERGKAEAKLKITGRDVEEKTLALTMDWATGCWQCEGNADSLEITDKRRELLDVIRDLGRATLPELVDATKRNKGTLYRDLQDLVNGGYVKKDSTSKASLYYLQEREQPGQPSNQELP